MMKLQINLSSRPFTNYTLYHLGYVVLGLAGLLLMAHNAYWFFSNHGDVRQMEQEIAALQTEVDRNILEAGALGEEIDRIQRNRRFREVCTFVDGRIRQRRFSWIKMLNLLQKAIPADVKIDSITPRVEQESVRITLVCMARKDAAVNEFIENLEGVEEFDRVLITSEDKEGSIVTFPLTLEYSPFGFSGAPALKTASGEPDAEALSDPASLADRIIMAELPDPEFWEIDALVNQSEDPFAVEGVDPFGMDDDFMSGMGGFGGEPVMIPASEREETPPDHTGSQKTKSSGDLIKQPPRKPGDRRHRPNPLGRSPGGRP